MKKILIVEDEIDIVRVLNHRLKQSGFQTVVAYDAIDAVKFAHQESPDLIILDIMLPAGGINVLKNIRLAVHLSFVPVIVLTGMQDSAKKAEIEKLKVDGYFEKPYDFPILLELINKLINPT